MGLHAPNICQKCPKPMTRRKRKHPQQVVLGKLDIYMQKNETTPITIILHRNTTKCIKNVNLKPETLKLLEEPTGNILHDLGIWRNS